MAGEAGAPDDTGRSRTHPNGGRGAGLLPRPRRWLLVPVLGCPVWLLNVGVAIADGHAGAAAIGVPLGTIALFALGVQRGLLIPPFRRTGAKPRLDRDTRRMILATRRQTEMIAGRASEARRIPGQLDDGTVRYWPSRTVTLSTGRIRDLAHIARRGRSSAVSRLDVAAAQAHTDLIWGITCGIQGNLAFAGTESAAIAAASRSLFTNTFGPTIAARAGSTLPAAIIQHAGSGEQIVLARVLGAAAGWCGTDSAAMLQGFIADGGGDAVAVRRLARRVLIANGVRGRAAAVISSGMRDAMINGFPTNDEWGRNPSLDVAEAERRGDDIVERWARALSGVTGTTTTDTGDSGAVVRNSMRASTIARAGLA